MLTNVFTVDQLRADTFAHAMTTLHANPKKIPPAYHSVAVEPGVAMLVEPVNDHAFVFMPPNTVCQFVGEPGSGTDKLRCRMHAGLFFNQIVEKSHENARRQAAQVDSESPDPALVVRSLMAPMQPRAMGFEVTQHEVDKACLRAIELRGEEITIKLPVDSGFHMQEAASDVSDFQKISDESYLQRFAAAQMDNNIELSPVYKVGFNDATAQHPGLIEKIDALNAENRAIEVDKEDRKATDMRAMAEDSQPASQLRPDEALVPSYRDPTVAEKMTWDAMETVTTAALVNVTPVRSTRRPHP